MTNQTNPSDEIIVIETELPIPHEQVWTALTTPEAVSIWWGAYVQLTPGQGGAFREQWVNDSGRSVTTTGRIVRWDPPSCLEFTWADDDWSVETRVRMTLETGNRGNRTLLRLVHTGWDKFPGVQRGQLIDAHTAGWRQHLRSLGSFLGTGEEPAGQAP